MLNGKSDVTKIILSDNVISDEIEEKIFEEYKLKFMYFVFKLGNSMSQKLNGQIFLLQLVHYWRFESVSNMNYFNSLGVELSYKTFNNHLKILAAEEKEKAFNLVENDSIIFWIDNFNKFYFRKFSSVSKNLLNEIDLTTITIEKTMFKDNSNISNDLNKIENIFLTEQHQIQILKSIYEEFKELKNFSSENKYCEDWLISDVKRSNYENSPNVIPYDLLNQSIKSKESAFEIFNKLDEILENYKFIKLVKSDIAVASFFWKGIFFFIVNYDNLGQFVGYKEEYVKKMRHWIMIKGTWHPIKILAEAIWKKYLFKIFGKLFWGIFSKTITVLKKPKFQFLLEMFLNFFNIFKGK